MAKDTNKKDPGYDVVDDATAEKIAIQELKDFDRGFGVKIKTFEEETNKEKIRDGGTDFSIAYSDLDLIFTRINICK